MEGKYHDLKKKIREQGNNTLELGRKQFRRGLFLLPVGVQLYIIGIIQSEQILRSIGLFFSAVSTICVGLGIYNQYYFWKNSHKEVELGMHGFPVEN